METTAASNQKQIVDEFTQLQSWEDRYKKIIQIGKELPKLPEEFYDPKYLVKGCQSQVWMIAKKTDDGKMQILADSDALIVRGLVALLLKAYANLTPQEILQAPPVFIEELGFKDYLSPSRANGFLAMVKQIMLFAQVLSLQ